MNEWRCKRKWGYEQVRHSEDDSNGDIRTVVGMADRGVSDTMRTYKTCRMPLEVFVETRQTWNDYVGREQFVQTETKFFYCLRLAGHTGNHMTGVTGKGTTEYPNKAVTFHEPELIVPDPTIKVTSPWDDSPENPTPLDLDQLDDDGWENPPF